jgi:dihydrofolate reductase
MKVILLVATTADGLIARNSMQFVDWTGKADKKYFVKVTKEAGVMIMGSNTFDTFGRVLPGRKSIIVTRDKTRKSHDPDLIFTDESPELIIKGLEEEGYSSAALIGGSVVNTLFLKGNLVNEIHLTIVPKLFGEGLNIFSETLDTSLELLDVEKISNTDILIKYRVLT